MIAAGLLFAVAYHSSDLVKLLISSFHGQLPHLHLSSVFFLTA
jgi:hypothetical protein